jgi:hypothetical protein
MRLHVQPWVDGSLEAGITYHFYPVPASVGPLASVL